jgi:CheY-like chemotaxis protein
MSAETLLGALSNAGFRTATVWDATQLVAFCRQHHPDLVVIDLALPGGSVWTAAQTLRRDPATADIPFIGLCNHLTETEMQQAQSVGFARIERKGTSSTDLIAAIRSIIPAPGSSAEPSAQPVVNLVPKPSTSNDNSPAGKLRNLINEILDLTVELKPRVPDFGPEGPELFGYIEGSGADIDRKLASLASQGEAAIDEALYDKDVRHDFRNMIGSVTGFAELILMEPRVPDDVRPRLTRIRECSRVFVDLLDRQKEAAAA